MPQNETIGDRERKRALKSLKGQVERARKQKIDDADAYAKAKFSYRTGYPPKVVDEFYEILLASKVL
jgi:hypothetical protein